MTLQPFEVNIETADRTKQVRSDCNAIQFVNLGTANVVINQNITLITNQTFTIEGNQGEICKTVFSISFTGVGTNNCVIVKKTYS